jgi:hypothetical protein
LARHPTPKREYRSYLRGIFDFLAEWYSVADDGEIVVYISRFEAVQQAIKHLSPTVKIDQLSWYKDKNEFHEKLSKLYEEIINFQKTIFEISPAKFYSKMGKYVESIRSSLKNRSFSFNYTDFPKSRFIFAPQMTLASKIFSLFTNEPYWLHRFLVFQMIKSLY